MRNDIERLIDIIDAIERIERYSKINKNLFETDELIQTWMVHNIQIIGEAAGKIAKEFQEQHPTIPWRSIGSMRNIIVHAYFKVDLDEVWNVIQNELPILKGQIQKLIDNTNSDSSSID